VTEGHGISFLYFLLPHFPSFPGPGALRRARGTAPRGETRRAKKTRGISRRLSNVREFTLFSYVPRPGGGGTYSFYAKEREVLVIILTVPMSQRDMGYKGKENKVIK